MIYLNSNLKIPFSAEPIQKNSFAISPPANHIFGLVDSNVFKYSSRNNCWTSPGGNNPIINLTRYGTQSFIPVQSYNSGYDCSISTSPSGTQVDYLGNGIYDTTKLTANNSDTVQTPAEILDAQGEQDMEQNMLTEAITSYKYLIDNYPGYENLTASLYPFYSSYNFLDTSYDQGYRNTLYGNLKLYMEEKIASDNYDEDFCDMAYLIILFCDYNIEDYDDASNGYEYIALFHPDPDTRLVASWNYAEIQAIIDSSGSGGGERNVEIGTSDLDIERSKEQQELKRLNNIVSNDPVLSKMKKNFEKGSNQRKQKIETQFNEKSKTTEINKSNLRKSNDLDNLKNDKAKRNLFELRNLHHEVLENRRVEDMLLTTRNIRNELEKDDNVNIPLKYNLSQNYPNPFNPTTTISYDIQNDGIVTIKVYDILGKEMMILVNEFKQTGSYKINFDGHNFSSGIYFYKIEAGNFNDTKRMVLLK